MSAPQGNQFWKLRSKHGRDKIFGTPDILWAAACEYFEWCEANPFMQAEQAKALQKPAKNEAGDLVFPPSIIELPKMRAFTLQGLCIFLGVTSSYFRQFKSELRKNDEVDGEDFLTVITRVEEIIYEQKFTGAAAGFLNPNIIARDLGLKDTQDINLADSRKAVADIFGPLDQPKTE